MYVFDHDLESVEAPNFGPLALVGEVHEQVFVNDTIGRGEEGERKLEKVLLIRAQLFPVVITEI